MSTPTIPAGNLFMNATLYTGNGTAVTVTNGAAGASFQPDLVWIKSRGTANQHNLIDSVRGVGFRLRSDGTNADEATPGTFTLNSNGFTTTTSNISFNGSGDPFVGWQWKAGGTAVSNTSGTITSQVSANTTSGFSVVTYTGNGSTGATVGHGLGVAPSMIIFKSRSTTGNWITYHSALGVNAYVYLNTTGGSSSVTPFTVLTSSTFALSQSYSDYNTNGTTYVAYCWTPIAGYSAFGSYTGNGSADGPFVFTNFQPRWVMIKRTDTAGYHWGIWDTSVNTYNLEQLSLYADSSGSEINATDLAFDGLSNGFKIRGNSLGINASGGTYVYACFASNPFKYSNAR